MQTLDAKRKGERKQLVFLDQDGEPLKPCRTEQHHKDMCQINNILKQYDKTGIFRHVNQAVAKYGDYTEKNEFQENLNFVIEAQKSFDDLPSHIRKKFNHDPGQFFEFATNPENAQEMVKLGLAKQEEIKEVIQKVEVVNTTTEAPAEPTSE